MTKAKTIAADLLITDVAELVTCDPGLGEGPLGVVAEGALAASEGRIVWVGLARDAEQKVKLAPGGRRLDARGRGAVPGFGAAQPVDVHANFCGAHEVPPEYKGRADDYVDLVVHEMIPAVAERKLARYVDVFCEEGVFSVAQTRRILEAGALAGLRAKFHADE